MADHDTIDPAAVPPADALRPDPPDVPDPLVTLQQERDDLYDRLLRKTAEFDNYRKRVERERREQADRAIVGLLEELLPVVDDFDRALTLEAGDEPSAYRKGIELIHSKLH